LKRGTWNTKMALGAGQRAANHPARIDGVPIDVEPARQKSLWLLVPEQRIANEIDMLGYPQRLLRRKQSPAVGTDNSRAQRISRLNRQHGHHSPWALEPTDPRAPDGAADARRTMRLTTADSG